jgi:drug/metabolite transporter (DMT)-like permease
MVLGLIGALGSALGYGVASVLQALAVRRTSPAEGLDLRLMVRLSRSWLYLLGLAVDGLAFLLSLVALRSLPLFVVQSIVASFLAVTAVLGALVLKMPLRPSDKIGIAVVIVGLVLVALSAAEDKTVETTRSLSWGVLVAAILLAVAAFPLARIRGAAGAATLGAVAGLGYGVAAVAADGRRGAHRPGHLRSGSRRRGRPAGLLHRDAARLGDPRDRTPRRARDRRPGFGRTADAR